MDEGQWLLPYIFLIFVVFISGLALLAAARSQHRKSNAYESWHARFAAAEGKPRHDGKERGWVPGVLLSLVALAAIAAGAIFFWPGWPDNKLILQISATFRHIRAGQQQTTSGIEAINDKAAAETFLAQTPGTKAINDIAAEDRFIALEARLNALQNAMTRLLRDNAELAERLKATQAQMAQDNASVAEQLKALTQHRDNVSAPRRSLRRALAGVLAQDSGESLHSEESLRPQSPLPQPNPTPAIPERRQNVMRNWF
jgi:hypothetical protein